MNCARCGRKQSWHNLGYYLSTEGVGIACWTAQGSVPGGSHKIFSSLILSRLTLWPTKSPVQRYLGSLPGSNGYSMALTTHLHPVLRSRMNRAKLLLPFCACMACLPLPCSDMQRMRKTQDSFPHLRYAPGISQRVSQKQLAGLW